MRGEPRDVVPGALSPLAWAGPAAAARAWAGCACMVSTLVPCGAKFACGPGSVRPVPRPRRARGAARTRVVDGAGLLGRSGLSVGSLGSFRAAAEMWPPETRRDVRSRPEVWLLRGILFLAFCLILFSLLFPCRLRGEDAAAAPPREPMRLPAAPAAPAFQTPRPRAAVAPLWFPAGSPNAAASSRPLVGWLFLPRALVGMGGSLNTLAFRRDLGWVRRSLSPDGEAGHLGAGAGHGGASPGPAEIRGAN